VFGVTSQLSPTTAVSSPAGTVTAPAGGLVYGLDSEVPPQTAPGDAGDALPDPGGLWGVDGGVEEELMVTDC
jgi:hypothetical protein